MSLLPASITKSTSALSFVRQKFHVWEDNYAANSLSKAAENAAHRKKGHLWMDTN